MNAKKLRALITTVRSRTAPFDHDVVGLVHTITVSQDRFALPGFPTPIGGVAVVGILATNGGCAQFHLSWHKVLVAPGHPSVARLFVAGPGLSRVLLHRHTRYLEFQLLPHVTGIVRGRPRCSAVDGAEPWAGLPSWDDAKAQLHGRRHGEYQFQLEHTIDFHIGADANRDENRVEIIGVA